MSIRSFVVLFLALICGLCAAVGVMRLRSNPTIVEPQIETVPVVVAAIDIPRGGLVSAEYLTTREYPKDVVPSGAVMSIEEAVDRAVVIQMLAGEPVLDKKLAGRDQGRGIAPLVREGMRAFTILTPTPAVAVAGFILPGNRVDVLLTVASSGRDDASGGGSTTTLLQNVEILAVDRNIDLPDSAISTESLTSVTLQISPEQVAKLTLAQNRGVLNLSLRNDADHSAGHGRPITMADLRYDQESPLVLAGEPPPPEPEEEIVVPAAERPQPHKTYNLRIRTLRGSRSGEAWLRYIERPNSDDPPTLPMTAAR